MQPAVNHCGGTVLTQADTDGRAALATQTQNLKQHYHWYIII